jgi:hypothetical protein
MPIIEPTIGRVVHYEPHPGDPGYNVSPGTRAAIIAGINDDGTLNLAVFDRLGHIGSVRNIPLVQDGETAPETGYAHWMPYQVGQAAKTEALQEEIAAATAKSTRAKRVASQAEPEPVPEADDDI